MSRTCLALAAALALMVLSGCSSPSERAALAARLANRTTTTANGTSTARSVDEYKAALAERIVRVTPGSVFIGRPQPLLRSVVVIRYAVYAEGRLLHSEILRSNHDRVTERTALSSLRGRAVSEAGHFPAAPWADRVGGNLAVRRRRPLSIALDRGAAEERMNAHAC